MTDNVGTQVLELPGDSSRTTTPDFIRVAVLPPCPHCESRYCGLVCRFFSKPRWS